MNKIQWIIAILASLSLSAIAQEGNTKISRLGIHAGATAGGDIDSSEFAYGAQVEIQANEKVFVELAISRGSDDETLEGLTEMDLDLTTVGLSLIYRDAFSGGTHLWYLLTGMNYNIVDVEVGDTVIFGETLTFDVDADNSVGFHVGAGANMPVDENWEIFVEYRFTVLEVDLDMSGTFLGETNRESAEGDLNFGIVKFGVNRKF